jgi:hypothetical protein
MNQPISSLRRAAAPLALLLAAIAGAAGADTTAPVHRLPSVVLEGRSNLQAACPAAAEVLQDELASVVRRWRQEGVMRVSFTLEGERISDVQAQAGPTLYRQQVRLAVATLKCRSQGDRAERHSFDIGFSQTVG